ncbi:unnamed protein product [Ilex paraguariensis]|uniref:Uncharacterized protein n=1 Tax=Ilex paraguariensis TaxID=185542 RepID=A0ABC8US33_9AQUA
MGLSTRITKRDFEKHFSTVGKYFRSPTLKAFLKAFRSILLHFSKPFTKVAQEFKAEELLTQCLIRAFQEELRTQDLPKVIKEKLLSKCFPMDKEGSRRGYSRSISPRLRRSSRRSISCGSAYTLGIAIVLEAIIAERLLR